MRKLIFERLNGLNTPPVITNNHIDFIRCKYNEGLSQTKIGELMECSQKLISQLMKEYNISIRTNREQALKSICNEDFFEVIDTEEKAYWLGFMYADGYILNKRKHSGYSIGISLTESDIHHIEKFKNSLNSSASINTYTTSKGVYNSKSYCRIIISSDKLSEDLIKQGCVIKKSNVLLFPNKNQVPQHLIHHFIRGYIDGDGSISYYRKPNNKINIGLGVVGTKELINGIKSFLNLSHLKSHQRHPEKDTNNYSFNVGGNIQVLKILDNLYKNATIYLDRKYEKYKEVTEVYQQQEKI